MTPNDTNVALCLLDVNKPLFAIKFMFCSSTHLSTKLIDKVDATQHPL